MAFQISTNYQLGVNRETVWGTPLTTGAKYLRLVSANLSPNLQFTESEEMNAVHRETADTQLTSARGGGQITGEMSYANCDMLMEAALGAAFSGTGTRTLKVGQLLKSLTFQERFADITGNQFRVYAGSVVSGFSIEVQTAQMIRFSASFASKQPTNVAATAIGTVAAAPTDPVMSPIASLQTLTAGGTALTACSSVSLQVTNDLIDLPALLSADPLAMFQGRFRVRGTIGVYMQDAVLLGKLLAGGTEAFVLKIGGASAKNYQMTLPKIKYTGNQVQGVSGSSAVTEQYTFDGLFDATDSSFKIVATD